MDNRRYRHLRNVFVVAGLIISASLLGVLCRDSLFGFTEIIIYSILASLLGAWCVSLGRRIMHKSIRHGLFVTAVTLLTGAVLDMLSRTIQTDFFTALISVLMGMIPAIVCVTGYIISCYAGMEEDDKANGIRFIPVVPSVILAGAVIFTSLTKEGLKYKPGIGYAVLYFAYMSGLIALVAMALGNFRRNSDKRAKWYYSYIVSGLGLIMILSGKIPDVLYGKSPIRYHVLFATITVALWETIINNGMVPSNSCYMWCFNNCSLGTSLMDNEGNVHFTSKSAGSLTHDTIEALSEGNAVFTSADTELRLSPVRGGYVIWERDLSEFNNLYEDLKDTSESIKYATGVLKENIDAKARREKLSANNRLYDLVISNVNSQIEVMLEKLKELDSATDEEFVITMRRFNVLGAYLKRKSNLVLISNEAGADLINELKLSLGEIVRNLNKAGISATSFINLKEGITIDIALLFMDLSESIIEQGINDMKELTIMILQSDGGLRITLHAILSGDETVNITVLQRSFEKWKSLLWENYSGSLDTTSEDNSYTVCAFIPNGNGGEEL